MINKESAKKRTAVILTFSALVFAVITVAIVIAGLIIILLMNAGVFRIDGMSYKADKVVLYMLLISLALGFLLSFFTGRFPLRPFTGMLAAMDSLASGDFSTRLSFGRTGKKKGWIGDVERSFNHMAEELEKTEMLRSDFVNNFSHEFKTPIVSIAGFAALLKSGNLTEEQKADYIGIIADESTRLADMATNVLNLTRVENQTILTDVTRFNISEQIRRCLLLLEKGWTDKMLELDVEFDEHFIEGSEELLHQVWLNIIGNAVKYADPGSVLRIAIDEDSTELHITVTDTGVVIPEENIGRLFEKFYQADESHKSEGYGVGLSIVMAAVRLHDGSVSVKSTKEATSFTVTLPKTRGAA